VKKTVRKTAPGIPFRGKKDPRNGHGPKKGAPNAGRPPEEYLTWLRGVIESPECRRAVQATLSDSNHPAFAKLYAACSDRSYGKPLQEVQASGDVTIRVVYDQ